MILRRHRKNEDNNSDNEQISNGYNTLSYAELKNLAIEKGLTLPSKKKDDILAELLKMEGNTYE